MRTSVHELLDGMTAAELDMIAADIPADLPDGAGDRIAALAAGKAGIGQKKKKHFNRYLLVAALAIIMASALVGCYVADEVQYARATEFFDLNNLSADGLSRSEIKRVYRDITTESLSYDKSFEVLGQNTRVVSLQGVDISITNFANNANLSGSDGFYPYQDEPIPSKGVYYDMDHDADENGNHTDAFLAKYLDGEQVWRTVISGNLYANGYLDAGDIVYVYGDVQEIIGGDPTLCVAAMASDSGDILWKKNLGERYSYPAAALTPEGDIALISCFRLTDTHRLAFCVLSRDGSIVKERVSEVPSGMINVGKAAATGDGYLVTAWYYGDWEKSDTRSRLRLMKLSAEGEPMQTLRYGDEGYTYEISDIREYDGRVFVSATARPAQSQLYRNLENEDYEIDSDHPFGNTTEKWRDRARAEFSAVLFIFDPDSGSPEQFYTVGGTFSGLLGTDDSGNLTWNVERILTCGFSPATSAFSIYGSTRRYVYTFDSAEDLLTQERTDLIGGYATH